jgi:hypothetical protein
MAVLTELVDRHILANVSQLVKWMICSGSTRHDTIWYQRLMFVDDPDTMDEYGECQHLDPLKFYLVSSDLAKVLRQMGVPVALQDEMHGLNVWGRCGSGYALEDEHVLIEAFELLSTKTSNR